MHNPTRVQSQNALAAIHLQNEERRKYLHRKLSDLIYDVTRVAVGMAEHPTPDRAVVRAWAEELGRLVDQAKPEGR